MPPEMHATRHRKYDFRFDYSIAVIVIGICTTVSVLLRSRIHLTNLAMIYLLGTITISVTCRRSVALLSTLAGVVSFYFFSIPHWDSFALEDYSHISVVITTLTVAIVITTLTVKIRSQTERATQKERRALALYQLCRDLSAETTVPAAARIAVKTLADIFDAEVDIFLTDDKQVIARRIGVDDEAAISDAEKLGAQSILDSGKTSTQLVQTGRQSATKLGMPLICGTSAVAVVTLIPTEPDRFRDPDQMHFLEALSDQIAVSIERLRSTAAVREAEVEIQTERTRNALLNAVSHDIKTPLASIYGAATSLLEEEARLSTVSRHELVESIAGEAERLNRVVNNLLEMTSLDAGLRAKKDWRPIEEIVGAALARLEKQLRDRPVTTDIAADLPWVYVDDVLFEQVFVNILENAVKYTPSGSPIEIAARRQGERINVSIRDRGNGLPPGEETRVFEKFFRGKTDGVRGVGLGLAICRAILHVHDGTISADNAPGCGTIIQFELPIGGVPPHAEAVPESTFT